MKKNTIDTLQSKLNRFVEVSVILTGFSSFELYGSGQVDAYFKWLSEQEKKSFMLLLEVMQDAPADPHKLDVFMQNLLQEKVLGPFVKSVIKLWYQGQWNDPVDADKQVIPSPAAYREGLMWSAVNAHPQAAKQQGFGAWAMPPESSEGV